MPDLNYSINTTPPLERCACGYLLTGTESGRCPECGRSLSSLGSPPIASYRERRFRFQRDFALYKDRIMILQRTKSGSGAWHPVLLEDLSPDSTTIWHRSNGYKHAFLPIVGAIVIGYKNEVWQMPASLRSPPFWIAGLLLITALAMIVSSIRLVERVRFHSFHNRAKPLLEIRKQGPDKETFDEFIAMIKKQVNKRQGSGDWVSLVPTT